MKCPFPAPRRGRAELGNPCQPDGNSQILCNAKTRGKQAKVKLQSFNAEIPKPSEVSEVAEVSEAACSRRRQSALICFSGRLAPTHLFRVTPCRSLRPWCRHDRSNYCGRIGRGVGPRARRCERRNNRAGPGGGWREAVRCDRNRKRRGRC